MLVKTSTVAVLMAVALPSVSAKANPQTISVQPDFGFCVPTIKFEGGLGERKADEFAFLAVDPVVSQGQQAEVDPNVVIENICSQVASACEANDAAKVLCRDSQAQVEALGTRDQTTADTWNDLISGGVSAPAPELKKRSEKRNVRRQIEFIPCSTEAWLDNCTGWPRKREEPVEKAAPVKREAAPKKAKRQIPFIPCSTEAWLDDCTGWP